MQNDYDGEDEEQIEKDIEYLLRREEYRVSGSILIIYATILLVAVIGIVSFW